MPTADRNTEQYAHMAHVLISGAIGLFGTILISYCVTIRQQDHLPNAFAFN